MESNYGLINITDFNELPPGVEIQYNKGAVGGAINDYGGDQAAGYWLPVTATSDRGTTPGILFTGISGLKVGQIYYYTVYGCGEDDSRPFLYISKDTDHKNIIPRTYLNVDDNIQYWDVKTVSFIATSTNIRIGVLLERVRVDQIFYLHSLSISISPPDKVRYMNLRPDARPDGYLSTAGYTPTTDDMNTIFVPYAYNGTISLPSNAIEGMVYKIVCTVTQESGNYWVYIVSYDTVSYGSYNEAGADDAQIADIYYTVDDGSSITSDNTSLIWVGRYAGSKATITRSNGRWILNMTVPSSEAWGIEE